MPRATEQDWANIALRMAKVPEALSRYRDTLEAGIVRERVASRRQVEACALQAEVVERPPAGHDQLLPRLAEEFGDSGVESPGLATELRMPRARRAAPAPPFGRYLRQRYLRLARPRDAVGADRYALGVRVYNGDELDLHETYDWGWDELRRIEGRRRRSPSRSCRCRRRGGEGAAGDRPGARDRGRRRLPALDAGVAGLDDPGAGRAALRDSRAGAAHRGVDRAPGRRAGDVLHGAL